MTASACGHAVNFLAKTRRLQRRKESRGSREPRYGASLSMCVRPGNSGVNLAKTRRLQRRKESRGSREPRYGAFSGMRVRPGNSGVNLAKTPRPERRKETREAVSRGTGPLWACACAWAIRASISQRREGREDAKKAGEAVNRGTGPLRECACARAIRASISQRHQEHQDTKKYKILFAFFASWRDPCGLPARSRAPQAHAAFALSSARAKPRPAGRGGVGHTTEDRIEAEILFR